MIIMIKYTPIDNTVIGSDNKNIFGYVGTDTKTGTDCGKCIAELNGYSMKIISLYSDCDNETVEGFIRSSLNYGANRNAYIAYYLADDGKDVAKLLGFTENSDGVLFGEIPELLAGSCCKEK